MKRLVICCVALAGVLSMKAQVPAASNPVCAECGGNEQRKEGGRWVQVSDHKSWCPIGKKIAEAKAKAKAAEWSPDFSSIEYQYGNGVMCDECERVQGHTSDCTIGFFQKKIYQLAEHDHSKWWAGSVESYKLSVRNREENIRNAARRGREERAKAQQARTSQQPTSATPQRQVSTKLKDHQPMPEQRPAAQPDPNITLIPYMGRMPAPVIPTTEMTVIRETGPDGTVYDKHIKFHDRYSAVAYCKMNPSGSEQWTMFSSDGKKLGIFSKVYTVERDKFDKYFIAQDARGYWGVYNLRGDAKLPHEYEEIEALAVDDNLGYHRLLLKCSRNGKWGIYGADIACEWDDIWFEDINPGLIFRVLKDGKYGIVEQYKIPFIPCEYTYLEKVVYQGGGAEYYIVSKDGQQYGVYRRSEKWRDEQLSLGEARDAIKADVTQYKQKMSKKRNP